MMVKSYNGKTYDEWTSYFRDKQEYYRNMFMYNVDFAMAVMEDPELYGWSETGVDDFIDYLVNECNLRNAPYHTIIRNKNETDELNIDDIGETIERMCNRKYVDKFHEKAEEMAPRSKDVKNALDDTVTGIFGMQVINEELEGLKTVLGDGAFISDDYVRLYEESYERKFLRQENLDAGFFFVGGGVSTEKMKIDKSTCKFRQDSEDGYIAFSLRSPYRYQLMDEVYHSCTFTGPCKVTLKGLVSTQNDDYMDGIKINVWGWDIATDYVTGLNLRKDIVTGEQFIRAVYCRYLVDGLYDLQDIHDDFRNRIKEHLNEVEFDVDLHEG